MNKLLVLSIFAFGLTATNGCYKDIDNTPEPTIIIERPDIKVTTALHGLVTDIDGNTKSNYSIEINDQSYTIDQDFYYLELPRANKMNQHISVVQEGKEIAFANVSLIENDNNQIDLMAFPAWNTSTNDQSISLDDALQIDVTTANNVNEINYGVIANQKILDQLGRWGRDENDNDYFLHTISSFYINAESLPIAANALSLQYDLSTYTTTDNTALFHLDETFHQWIMVTTLNSNTGSINLPQYGHYIIANINNSTFTEGEISFEDLPMAFQNLDLSLSENISIKLKTTGEGRWSTFLPADQTAELSISDPCETIVYEEEIETSPTQSIKTILTNDNSTNIIPLSFKNIDCNGDFLLTQSSILDFDTKEQLMVFTNQKVEIAVLSCEELKISGYDLFNNTKGMTLTWGKDIDDKLDYLSVCEDFVDGYSFFKINGEPEMLPTFTVDIENDKTVFKSEDNNIRLIIKGEGIGDYLTNEVNFYINDETFGDNGYRMFCENSLQGCGIDDCYISHYEEMSNGLIRLSFSGVLWMQTIQNSLAGNYPIQGQILITI